jgi:hypothetical protein
MSAGDASSLRIDRDPDNLHPTKFVVGQSLDPKQLKLDVHLQSLKTIQQRVGLRVVASSPTHVSVGLTVDGATAEMAELRFRVDQNKQLVWTDGKLEPFAKSFRLKFPEVDSADFIAMAQKNIDDGGVQGQALRAQKLWVQKTNGSARPAVVVAVEKHIKGRGHIFEDWVFDAKTKELLRTRNGARHLVNAASLGPCRQVMRS